MKFHKQILGDHHFLFFGAKMALYGSRILVKQTVYERFRILSHWLYVRFITLLRGHIFPLII